VQALPGFVSVVEGGPVEDSPEAVTIDLVDRLVHAGLKDIEVGKSAAIIAKLPHENELHFPIGVTDLATMEQALKDEVREITVDIAASENLSHRTYDCSIENSLRRLEPVALLAAEHGVRLRGRIDGVIASRRDGPVAPENVTDLCSEMANLGCFEVCLADSAGNARPGALGRLWDSCAARIGPDRLALRLNNSRGLALSCLRPLLEQGLQTIDTTIGGFDGTVATEDVVVFLTSLDIGTGVDIQRLSTTAWWYGSKLGRPPAGRNAHGINS